MFSCKAYDQCFLPSDLIRCRLLMVVYRGLTEYFSVGRTSAVPRALSE